LRQFIEKEASVPIVVHPDPDPDALASALAVRALLRRDPASLPIVTLGAMTRPENRRMAELLGMRVTVVTEAELKKFDHIIAVDHQPVWLDEASNTLAAVIDHHPIEKERPYHFSDLRPNYGATATVLTEYICADDERRVDEKLATALLYGIKTDTDSLMRGCSPADVKAYAYVLARADLPLLRRLERPSYKPESARAYGEALAHLGMEGDVAVTFLGKLPDEDTHILVDVADFCIALEEITWSAAAAVIGDQLEFTLRHLGGNSSAGDLAKIVAGEEGSGGGHATMARARVPLTGAWQSLVNADIQAGTKELLRRICAAVEQLRANRPRSSRPARQETSRPAGNQ
jgi:nanoRNase/pAp phosphatase (c-di-AMP/oligoRNAs hydrolase)